MPHKWRCVQGRSVERHTATPARKQGGAQGQPRGISTAASRPQGLGPCALLPVHPSGGIWEALPPWKPLVATKHTNNKSRALASADAACPPQR